MSEFSWKSPSTIIGIVTAVVSVVGLGWTISQNLFATEPERCARRRASLEREREKAKERFDAKWEDMRAIFGEKARQERIYFDNQQAGKATAADTKNYEKTLRELDQELAEERIKHRQLEDELNDVRDEIDKLNCP